MLPKDRGRSPVSCVRAVAYVSKLLFVRRIPAVFQETGGGVGGMRPEAGSFLPPPALPASCSLVNPWRDGLPVQTLSVKRRGEIHGDTRWERELARGRVGRVQTTPASPPGFLRPPAPCPPRATNSPILTQVTARENLMKQVGSLCASY